MEVTGDIWNYKPCKAPVNSSLKHSNTQLFTDQMPFLTSNQQCETTEGKSIIFHRLSYPTKLTWGSSKSAFDHWRLMVSLGEVASHQPSNASTPIFEHYYLTEYVQQMFEV